MQHEYIPKTILRQSHKLCLNIKQNTKIIFLSKISRNIWTDKGLCPEHIHIVSIFNVYLSWNNLNINIYDHSLIKRCNT